MRLAITLAAVLVATRGGELESVAADGQRGPQPGKTVAEQILGEWVQYRDTPEGRWMTVKEHTGDRTILTTFDPNHVAVYAHSSEYRIDDSGAALVFRYRNKIVLIGPDAGKRDDRVAAYLFRVEDDRFIEVHGMMKEDTGKPSLTIWRRRADDRDDPDDKPKP